jgi:hypothetical protein
MTKYDDRERIRSAAADDAEFRRQCREGTDKYAEALIAAHPELFGLEEAA